LRESVLRIEFLQPIIVYSKLKISVNLPSAREKIACSSGVSTINGLTGIALRSVSS
jgi:hypothetical protein